MGSVVLKLASDLDEYVVWTTVCDSPASSVGNRESMIEHLVKYYSNSPVEAMERVERADRTGTSMMAKGWGRWASKGFLVYEAMGEHAPRWLPRKNLRDFCLANDEDDMDAKLALTDEITD